MIRKVFVKITAVILLFSFLISLTGIHAYSAESGYYDGVWEIKSDYWTTFSIHIEGDQMEAFSLTYAEATYNFPSAKIENNSLITADGDNELHVFFNSSDNTAATGQLEIWPKEDSDIGSFGRVNITAKNLSPKPSTTPTPIPSNVTILDKTKWTNILPAKDQKLADSLACLNDAAWNGKNYVIVGRGRILSSADGSNWKTAYSMKEDHSLFGVVWNGKEFTAIGNDESENTVIVLKSTDAMEWKLIKTEINSFMLDLAWNNKMYAAVGRSATLITSADGIKWTKADIPTDSDFNSIIWAGNRFVAVGNNVIAVSPDGSDWEVITDQKGNFTGVVYYKEQYCIFDLLGKVLITKDFSKWNSEQIVLPDSGSFITNASCSKDLVMVAMSDQDVILSTTDLTQWTLDPLQKEDYVAVNNVVYINDRFYAVGPKYISLYQPETAEKITVIINGSGKKLSQSPYMSGIVVMLPVKAVLEAAGAKVEVSGKAITVTYGKKKAVLTIGSSKAVLNKENVKLEAKVTSKNKVIFAPLEKIVEALGGTYQWDGKKKTVTIHFK